MLPPPQGSGIPDGPQWVLDQWGNAGTTSTARTCSASYAIEDIAYDKRPGKSNIVYLADSRPCAAGGAGAGKLDERPDLRNRAVERANQAQAKLSDPHRRRQRSPWRTRREPPSNRRTLARIHQPDNVETTVRQPDGHPEDPERRRTRSRRARAIRGRRTRESGDTTSPAERSRSSQPSTSRPLRQRQTSTPSKPDSIGSWESSGIVDASSIWGRAWFLLDVQAHTLWVDCRSGPDVVRTRRPGLDVQARGRSAPRDQDPGRVARARRSRMRASLRRRPRRLRLQRRCGVETR